MQHVMWGRAGIRAVQPDAAAAAEGARGGRARRALRAHEDARAVGGRRRHGGRQPPLLEVPEVHAFSCGRARLSCTLGEGVHALPTAAPACCGHDQDLPWPSMQQLHAVKHLAAEGPVRQARSLLWRLLRPAGAATAAAV